MAIRVQDARVLAAAALKGDSTQPRRKNAGSDAARWPAPGSRVYWELRPVDAAGRVRGDNSRVILMFRVGCDKSRRPGRGTTAALALAGVLAASLGVPLPALVVKTSSTPYPCQHHACGCDADSCWRDCCCMSHQEKLAWARENGVTPPEFVVFAAQREAAQELARAHDHKDCDGEATHASCSAESDCCSKPRSCCSTKPQTSAHESAHAEERRDSSSEFTLMFLALRCRGVSVSVSMLPPCLPVSLGSTEPTHVAIFDLWPREANLYQPPVLAVTSPPPDSV